MDYIKNRPEDFMIRVRPFLDKKERWTGEIDVVIVTHPDNGMEDDDYYQVMHICKMISSVIPIMDKDTAVREMMNDYVINSLDTDSKDAINNKGTVKNIKDNVITINFKPSTKH